MDQETREAVASLAADLKQHVNERHDELVGRFDAVDDRLKRVETSVADLKQHINERHSELVGRFDAVDDRLKRVETSVAYLENQEKGRNRPRGGGGSIHGNRKMAAKGRGG